MNKFVMAQKLLPGDYYNENSTGRMPMYALFSFAKTL
jgi:hypothetical protein